MLVVQVAFFEHVRRQLLTQIAPQALRARRMAGQQRVRLDEHRVVVEAGALLQRQVLHDVQRVGGAVGVQPLHRETGTVRAADENLAVGLEGHALDVQRHIWHDEAVTAAERQVGRPAREVLRNHVDGLRRDGPAGQDDLAVGPHRDRSGVGLIHGERGRDHAARAEARIGGAVDVGHRRGRQPYERHDGGDDGGHEAEDTQGGPNRLHGRRVASRPRMRMSSPYSSSADRVPRYRVSTDTSGNGGQRHRCPGGTLGP